MSDNYKYIQQFFIFSEQGNRFRYYYLSDVLDISQDLIFFNSTLPDSLKLLIYFNNSNHFEITSELFNKIINDKYVFEQISFPDQNTLSAKIFLSSNNIIKYGFED